MGWLQKALYGIDLDEEQRRQEELDAQLAALNRQKLLERSWNLTQYELATAQLEASDVDIKAQVAQAWTEGLAEGAADVRGVVGGSINSVIGTAASSIPWQIWFAAMVWVFFAAGGPKWLSKMARAR
jgi:hypothetical protein